MKNKLTTSLIELLGLDSVSREEGEVREFVKEYLQGLSLKVDIDEIGNVVGYVPAYGQEEGEAILLNAHMDRVPPGRGNKPVIKGDIVTSDGSTNLGADDAAGIAIILEVVSNIVEKKLPHPPLVLLFTVQEEIGLWGAKAANLEKYQVKQGIVFDNAFEAGAVVSRGAAYEAVDVVIHGKETHPGKDLSEGVNALSVFMKVDPEMGSVDDDQTRINYGILNTGKARNVVPGELIVAAEIRSLLNGKRLEKRVEKIKKKFELASLHMGAKIDFVNKRLAEAYEVDEQEPLLKAYKEVLAKRGQPLIMKGTFVASDANALRAKGIKAFVISTGVTKEHSVNETVNLTELRQISEDMIDLIR